MSIRFRHFRDRRMTVGFRARRMREEAPGLRVEVAVALANPTDNFSRRMGRQVVESRLNSRREDIPHRHFLFFNDVPMPESGEEWKALEALILEELPEHEDFGYARAVPEDWTEHVQSIME